MTGVAVPLDEAPVQEHPVPALELGAWRERFGITAGITLKENGLKLRLATAEPAAVVHENWRRLRAAMRPAFRAFVLGLQEHGTNVAIHRTRGEGWRILDGVDGHVTDVPGLLLLVTVADCVPVYLAHPGTGAVGLVHAGWRGAAAGILDRGLDALSNIAKCESSDFIMHCGIGICGDCYEVGHEVMTAVTGTRATGTGHLDLRDELCRRARGLGVAEISASSWCTAHDESRFHSHRRSGGTDGRMAAYIGRPSPGPPALP